jgi:hypothetical protein
MSLLSTVTRLAFATKHSQGVIPSLLPLPSLTRHDTYVVEPPGNSGGVANADAIRPRFRTAQRPLDIGVDVVVVFVVAGRGRCFGNNAFVVVVVVGGG